MRKLTRYKNICLCLFVVQIVVAFIAPNYHHHEYDLLHHSKHDHKINIYSTYDDSDSSDFKEHEKEVLSDEYHDNGYHFHFKKDLHRTDRIYKGNIKADHKLTLDILNNLSTNSLPLTNYKHNYYVLNHQSKNSAKTSSGLSPPHYSL